MRITQLFQRLIDILILEHVSSNQDLCQQGISRFTEFPFGLFQGGKFKSTHSSKIRYSPKGAKIGVAIRVENILIGHLKYPPANV